MSTETLRIIRDRGEPGRPSRLSHVQLLSSQPTHFFFSVALRPQRPYRLSVMESPGRHTIKDGEPRTSTSTFTQPRSSQPTHFFFNVALRPQRPYRLSVMESPGRKTIKDGQPRTSTSAFTQPRSSDVEIGSLSSSSVPS